MKATIDKIPGKYIVTVGKLVGYADSQYAAQQIATELGATEIDFKLIDKDQKPRGMK